MSSLLTYFHDLHQIPEVSGQEKETSEYVKKALADMGYPVVSVSRCGAYVDLLQENCDSYILLRADMDALPIQEPESHEIRSQHPGAMHACGHDSHMSMLLEAARRLKGQKLPHNIRFLFQPSEENGCGAADLLQADPNLMPKNLKACFAFHVWPVEPYGTVVTKVGALMASTDVFRVDIQGLSAHCGLKEMGHDALQTAVDIAAAFPGITAQCEDERTLLFLGSIHSGKTHNVVPDTAMLYGTIRAFSEPEREGVKKRLQEAVEAASARYQTQAEVIYESGSPVIDNSAQLIHELKGIFPDMVTDVQETKAGEDFSRYQKLAPGVMMWLGMGKGPALHSVDFVVPDELLEIGVQNWIKIARHPW